MELESIKQIAAENMENRSSHSWKEPGNKFFHGERVAKLTLMLRKIVLPEDNTHDDILTVAAWFHDVRNGEEEHCEKGAQTTQELLNGICNSKELKEICEIIALHDNRTEQHHAYSDYVKLHQDADLLDHFGSYDVWMHFAYASAHNQTLQQMADYLKNVRLAEDQRYLNELNFSVSKAIYLEKSNFLKQFTERFCAERSGEIWNFEQVLSGMVQRE